MEKKSGEKKFKDTPTAGRYCEIKRFGKVDEQIIHHDNKKHQINWSAKADKLPKFVSNLKNDLTIEIIDKNTSLLTKTKPK